MDYQNYYETLGVQKGATEKEIKSAYRKLARQHHPDVNPGDKQAEERFKSINEAYEVLSDPAKRKKYDRLGSDWNRWQQQGGSPSDFDWTQWGSGRQRHGNVEDLGGIFGGGGFSDFFGQIFGSMGGRRGFEYRRMPQKGRDRIQEIEITLQEAHQGAIRVLTKGGNQRRVRIPAGARTGTKVRFTGEGNPGQQGGGAGDLYLLVKVIDDPRFERKGDNLHSPVEVDLYTALLGGKVPVQTPGGTLMLTIKPGTQNGQTFRLRGKGMPKMRKKDEYGDLYAKVDVRLPTDLTRRQRELLEEMRKEGGSASA